MTLPWLEPQMTALRAAVAADRMPHALLIHEAPGAGGDWLANWIARLLLRTDRDQHPDWINLRPIDDSRQVRIEQVRELAAELALTSHQGGYKVGVISPADALNRFAANALLKTLEEPSPRTALILAVTQPSRLPATILSRCQRVRIPTPERAQSVAWLEEHRGKADWQAVLDIVGEAPMLAAESDAQAVVQIGAEVRRGLEEILAGTADPVATAERWVRAELPLRLRCFANWLTERIHAQSKSQAFLTEVGAVTYLQRPQTVLNMRELFELLDGVRDLEAALDSPLNRGLALEIVLRRLATRASGSTGATVTRRG
jgi:DNA polymerase-3 subunit delta'